MPDGRPQLARLCERVEDWDVLFRLAHLHGMAGALYAVSVVFGPIGGLIWLALPQRHLEA